LVEGAFRFILADHVPVGCDVTITLHGIVIGSGLQLYRHTVLANSAVQGVLEKLIVIRPVREFTDFVEAEILLLHS
jgi:hypothetical protein